MKSRFVKFFLLLWGVGAIIGAAATLSVWAVRTYRMLAWPTVTGIVRESSVATSLNGRGAAFYANVLSVEYSVAGVTNRTWRTYPFGNGCSTARFMHEARKAAFPVGAAVAVYYNPTDSTDAFVGHVGLGEVLWGLIPLVLLTVGVAILCVLVRRKSRRNVSHN